MRAFPGAEGYGAEALTASRALPCVVHQVTNTNNSGAGSLRAALSSCSASNYNIIIFRTGGLIELSSRIDFADNINHVYIAGQTAPGGGIVVRNQTSADRKVFWAEQNDDISNIAVRYMTLIGDGYRTQANSSNTILDHVSCRWSQDQLAAAQHSSDPPDVPSSNLTFQRCIFTEPGVPTHSTVLLFGNSLLSNPINGGPKVSDLSLHHCLLTNGSHRFPLIGPLDGCQVINNVMYNWMQRASEIEGNPVVDWIANYYKHGPMSGSNRIRVREVTPPPSIHIVQNIAPGFGFTSPTQDNFPLLYEAATLSMIRGTPLTQGTFPITIQTAQNAYDSVLADVGNNSRIDEQGNWVARQDSVDARIITEVQNNTGPSTLPSFGTQPSVAAGTAPTNTLGDGIPDAFRQRYYGGPTAGPAFDAVVADGYLLIEHWLNGTAPVSDAGITEDFSGTLSAWTQMTGSWSIVSGELQGARSGASNEDGYIRHDTPMSSTNHQAKVSNLRNISPASTTNQGGVTVRGNISNHERYQGELERAGTNLYDLQLMKFSDTNVRTLLAESAPFALNDAYNVEITLTAEGSLLTLSITSPAQSLEVIDTSIPSGTYCGIAGRLFSAARNAWDNFDTQNLAAAVAVGRRSIFFL